MSNRDTPCDSIENGLRKYATTEAFAAALRAHLNKRMTSQRTIQDLRKALAFERVLARLMRVAPDLWLLKGGVALEYRLDSARATRDIDISTSADIRKMRDALNDAASVHMDDYFRLRIGSTTKPIEELDTDRVAIDVVYENGKVFERLTLDIGTADEYLGAPQVLTRPSLLEFADVPPIIVWAIPLTQHLAEKIHAYTKTYGGKYQSTRVKDLVDMVLLINAEAIDEFVLAQTLRDVFASRGTHDVPLRLAPPPKNWAKPYKVLARQLPVPQESLEAYERVATALASVLVRAASLSVRTK